MERINNLIREYYQLINNSGSFDETPGECYKKAQLIKNEINLIKEEFKNNEELYNILTEFCNEEYNPMGWKKVQNEKD